MKSSNKREESNKAAIKELKGKISREELDYKMKIANNATEEVARWKQNYNQSNIDTSVIPNYKKNKKITYYTKSKLPTQKRIYL
jgi:hypothetical protein